MSIANGAITMTRRIDLISAQQTATDSAIALPAPNLKLGPTPNQMKSGLKKLLAQPYQKGSDPLGADRAAITKLINGNPTGPLMFPYVQKYLPSLAIARTVSLNGAFVKALKQARPDWQANDSDLITTAFYVSAGTDYQSQSYAWQYAMAVAGTITTFGESNVSLFTRNTNAQNVIKAVLTRFGSSDLSTIDSTTDLLKAVLSSTLNGVLDAQTSLAADVNNTWVTALLEAVSNARSASADPDNFVMGLLQGKGYPSLVGNLMVSAGGVLEDSQASAFQKTAVTFLTTLGKTVEAQPSFKTFFNDHWGTIIQAGMTAVSVNGSALLAGQNPLLGQVLSSVTSTLAKLPVSQYLTTGTLSSVVQAAATAVAANPSDTKTLLGEEWLNTLVTSVAGTLSGVDGSIFTKGTAETLLQNALTTFGENPSLIVKNPGLAQSLVGDVLTAIGKSNPFNANDLATAAVSGALQAISKDPSLADSNSPYLQFVAALAGNVSTLVASKQITGINGSALLSSLLNTVATEAPALMAGENPVLIQIVSKVAGNLAILPADNLLSVGTLASALQAAAQAVAANPTQTTKLLGKAWLGALVGSVATTISTAASGQVFSASTAEAMIQNALTTFGKDPSLIVSNPGLLQSLVGGVLTSVGKVNPFNASDLANAAVTGALNGVAADPGLAGSSSPYLQFVATLAGNVATLVSEKKLTGVQGSGLLTALTSAVSSTPNLVSTLENDIASPIVSAVVSLAGGSNAALVAGSTLVQVADSVAAALGSYGSAALKNHPIDQFATQLSALLGAGLSSAATQLGTKLGSTQVPAVLGQLVINWSQGLIANVDPQNANFQALVLKLAEQNQPS